MSDHYSARVRALLDKHLPAVERMRDIGDVVLPPQKRGQKCNFPPETINEWVRLYRRHTTQEIAAKFNVHSGTVKYHLQGRVKFRKPGQRPSVVGRASVIRSRQSSLSKLSEWFKQPRMRRITVLGRPAYEVLAMLGDGLESAYQKKA